jgi:hypothetical protein
MTSGIIAPVLKRAQERCSALRNSRLASALCRRTPVSRRRQRHRIGSLGSDGTRNRCKPVITFAELLLAAKKGHLGGAACEQYSSSLPTRTCLGQRSGRIRTLGANVQCKRANTRVRRACTHACGPKCPGQVAAAPSTVSTVEIVRISGLGPLLDAEENGNGHAAPPARRHHAR